MKYTRKFKRDDIVEHAGKLCNVIGYYNKILLVELIDEGGCKELDKVLGPNGIYSNLSDYTPKYTNRYWGYDDFELRCKLVTSSVDPIQNQLYEIY